MCKKIGVLALCLGFYLSSYPIFAQMSSQMASAVLLEKAIGYHDPSNQWPVFKAILKIKMETPNNPDRLSLVQLNNAQGVFSLEATKGNQQTFYRVGPQGCTLNFNGSEDFSEAQAKTHRLTCEQANKMKNYYTYLYGLPMKLKDPGTHLEKMALRKIFKGKEYWVLRVSYDPAVGKDVWYFYFDTNTYALKHYQFYHDEKKGDGEYILLSEEENIAGIIMPKNRAWYTNLEGKYLGTDFLLSPE